MTNEILTFMPVVLEEHIKILDSDFQDIDEEEDDDSMEMGMNYDRKLQVDKDKDPILFEIVEIADKLKKSLKPKNKKQNEESEDEEEDAIECLHGLDEHVYKDDTDNINEILVFETTLKNLEINNQALFGQIK